MAMNLSTVKSRCALKPRHSPYWYKMGSGCFLGFRKVTSSSTGVWVARYRNAGSEKQVLKSLGSFDELPDSARFDKAKRNADEWFAHFGKGGTSGPVTVGDACQDFLCHIRADSDKARSNAAGRDAEGRFRRWVYSDEKLASTSLQKLAPRHVEEWRRKLQTTLCIPHDKTKHATKARAASSVDRDVAVLRAALNRALENGDVTSDYAWRSKLTTGASSGRRRAYLDVGQRMALIQAAAPDIAMFLSALSLVPLRPGAVASLTVANWSRPTSSLTIGRDKSGEDRTIKLPAEIAAIVMGQCKDKPSAAPLFCRADGKQWNKDSWKGPIAEAAAIAGLPKDTTAYTIRHAVITDLISVHGVDTLTVAKLSGTSLRMIEARYGHLIPQRGADALARLSLRN